MPWTHSLGGALQWSEMPSLRKVVNARTSKGLISGMYGCISKVELGGGCRTPYRGKWEEDFGQITEEQLNIGNGTYGLIISLTDYIPSIFGT